MAFCVWTVLTASLLLSTTGLGVLARVDANPYELSLLAALTVEERLFENFLSNYSKSYWNDLDTRNTKFKVFQVLKYKLAL